MKDGQLPTARFFAYTIVSYPYHGKSPASYARTPTQTYIPKNALKNFPTSLREPIDGFAKSLAKCANKNGVLLGTPLLYRLRNENAEVVIL